MSTPTQIRGSTQIMSNTVTSGQVDATIIIAGGGNAFSGNQSFGGNKATNLANGAANTDACTYGQALSLAQGLSQKPTARVATAAALAAGTYNNGSSGVGATFTVTATGTLIVDGVVTALGDVILVKNQASAFQNGLYTVTTAGAIAVSAVLTRSASMNTPAECEGAFVPVDNEGTANANTSWLSENVEAGITIGTTSITFVQMGGTGYSAGTGITISGMTISITAGGVGPTQLASQASGTGLTGGAGSNLQIQRSTRETPSGTINGSNTSFSLANTPMSGTEDLYLNGVLQDAGASNDYTISGGTITMNTAPVSGDKLRCSYFY